MGDYTRVGLVRSSTGFDKISAPSGTVNFCIQRGEAALKLFLGVTPATATVSGSTFWVRDVATSLSAHYLCMRLATQNAPAVMYARGIRQEGGATWRGYAVMAEHHWNNAIRLMEMYGRKVELSRIIVA